MKNIVTKNDYNFSASEGLKLLYKMKDGIKITEEDWAEFDGKLKELNKNGGIQNGV